MLETDELKQLLQKSSEFDQTTEMLSEDDKSIIVDLFKEPLENVAKAMKKVLRKECGITEVTADIAKASLVKETLGDEYLLLDANYKTGLSTFAFDVASVKKMASIMLETVPEEGELIETEKNAFQEVFSQMVSALGKALSKAVDANVEPQESTLESKLYELNENVLQLSIGLTVNDDINTNIYYYISYGVVNALINVIKSNVKSDATNKFVEEEVKKEVEEESTAAVQPIQFEELTEELVADEKENMNLLMDLQLQVSVELGKVKKPIKDILQFTQGTIVELDRLAGDNVDVLVSGKIIAKGEVVVVDQNFGVRITKIVLPEKRV